jgi:hypothetical protein
MIDYIIPFSKNVKGIENVAKAYYQAEKWVENSLFYIKNNFWTNFQKNFDTNKALDDSIRVIAIWNILPPVWQWNSDFSLNYNRIRSWEPIQLEIGDNQFWPWSARFTFKIPDISNSINSW